MASKRKSKGFIAIKVLMSGKMLALTVSAGAVITGVGLQAAHTPRLITTHAKASAATPKTSPVVHKPAVAKPKPAATPTPPPSTPAPTPAPVRVVATPPPTPAPVSSPAAVAAANTQPGKAVSGLSQASPGSSPTPTPTPTSPPATQPAGTSQSQSNLAVASDDYTSQNWSGYFMSGHTFTSVSGSWTATNPTGNDSTTTADGTWIGIGGVNTNDLIQIGTENTISASGRVSTSAFYELIPAAPVYLSTVLVKPGDAISAGITETSPGQWTITFTDNSTGATYSTSVSYTSTHTSAEWIQEDPSYAAGGLVPFDNFGTAYFTGSSATGDGTRYSLQSGNASTIALVDSSNKPLSLPSVLDSSGSGFNVYRQ